MNRFKQFRFLVSAASFLTNFLPNTIKPVEIVIRFIRITSLTLTLIGIGLTMWVSGVGLSQLTLGVILLTCRDYISSWLTGKLESTVGVVPTPPTPGGTIHKEWHPTKAWKKWWGINSPLEIFKDFSKEIAFGLVIVIILGLSYYYGQSSGNVGEIISPINDLDSSRDDDLSSNEGTVEQITLTDNTNKDLSNE